MEIITTYTMEFDGEWKETILKNIDGTYTIFLKPDHTDEEHAKSYIIGLFHVKNDTFGKLGTNRIELE